MAKRKAPKRAKPAKSAKKGAAVSRSAKRPTAKRSVKRQASAKKTPPVKKARKNALPKGRKAEGGKAGRNKAARNRAGRHKAGRTKAEGKRTGTKAAIAAVPGKVPRLDRARRTLPDAETHTTPPSSLDMNRHGSAARTGRAGMEHDLENHNGMSPDITGGDVDVDVEDAYFTGDEAPGGDNPTPDQDIVDDIGKALGVTYDDAEELKASDKVVQRDKHRWEMDPASSEDYKDRK